MSNFETFVKRQEAEKERRQRIKREAIIYCIDRSQQFEHQTGLDKQLPFEGIGKTLFHLIMGLELMALQRDDIKTHSRFTDLGSSYAYSIDNEDSAAVDEKLLIARDFKEEFIRNNYQGNLGYVSSIQHAVSDLFLPYANQANIILPSREKVKAWAQELIPLLNPQPSTG